MAELKQYKNGLRLCVQTVPSVRSVAVGIMVGVGSENEDSSTNGLSHLVEHMMFKGTSDMNPYQIASRFEDIGASINAFTSKASTCYYFKVVDKYLKDSFALLCELFYQSTFPEEELIREKNVVIEEINMGEDSPEDICYDLLAEAAYGKSGLGRCVIGTKENVANFTQNDIKTHISKYYVSHNTVICFVGNITLEQADELVSQFALIHYGEEELPPEKPKAIWTTPSVIVRIKDFEQSNLSFAYPSVSSKDSRADDQTILSVLMGGGMSSRLFQSVREKEGLAYSIYTSPVAYANTGYFSFNVNYSVDNTEKVCLACKKEIDLLRKDGVTAEEVERAKIQLISSLVFSQENVQSVMLSQCRWLLGRGSDLPYDINEMIASIERRTVESVNEMVRAYFDDTRLFASYVGKDPRTDVFKLLTQK